MEGSIWCAANYVPLTPLSFLERAAVVFGDRRAVISGDKQFSWRETRERCLAGASALAHLGVGRRDVVAVIASNIPAMYELHFSVPMTGGVLCTLNTRHDAAMVSVLLEHSEAKVFLVESQFLAVAHKALRLLADNKAKLPLIITISDIDSSIGNNDGSAMEYEALLQSAPRGFDIRWPTDERDPISLNYTSGTTSRPKGVIYSHRGAYLNSLATVLSNEMTALPVYLWTVPMFHGNGWCLVWGTAAQGGTSGLHPERGAEAHLRADRAPLRDQHGQRAHGAQHDGERAGVGEEAAAGEGPRLDGRRATASAGSRRDGGAGLRRRARVRPHRDVRPGDALRVEARVGRAAGVPHVILQDVAVKDPVTMATLPSDGRAVGEVMLRGNTVMSGYYKDAAASEQAIAAGGCARATSACGTRTDTSSSRTDETTLWYCHIGGDKWTKYDYNVGTQQMDTKGKVWEKIVISHLAPCKGKFFAFITPEKLGVLEFNPLPTTRVMVLHGIPRNVPPNPGGSMAHFCSFEMDGDLCLFFAYYYGDSSITTSIAFYKLDIGKGKQQWREIDKIGDDRALLCVAQGGTSVCLRSVVPELIFDCIARHGAPTVLNMIANAPASDQRKPLPRRVCVSTAGAPPPPQVLAKMEEPGFDVVHGYGLTKTYAGVTVCVWKPEWNALPPADRARIKALQGVPHVTLQEVAVKDPVTMETLPSDGRAVGEVMVRGNTVMSGYYKDAPATEEAMRGGWLRTGDLGVRHPDGYIQLKDRSKDVIISGGENISSIEVGAVLFGHPAVLDAAVVARPDDHWGEMPCAFVMLKDGSETTATDIIDFCRAQLPHYMAPRTVVFSDLPKTSTGKTQKYLLRERTKAMGSLNRQGRSKL
ncbi:hypothetical protein EJB05_08117, partial [Eragrostis curvula]